MTVKYLDFFSANLTGQIPSALPPDLTYHGIALSDNFPKTYNSIEICSDPESRIQTLFTSPLSSSASINDSYLWGSVCPIQVVHEINDTKQLRYDSHLSHHNSYGHQSLKLVHKTLENNVSPNEMLITSSSTWISSLYYEGFQGLQVPFTWQGLKESVAHTVRNYALSPISGTPICGSQIFNVSLSRNNDLCLRWFQFRLLLPIARNSYDGESTFGPLHFSDQYKGYLNETIKASYTYAPYYYTTLYQYQKTQTPFLTPMSFHFDNGSGTDIINMLPLLDQFMIGEAILAAPVIDRGVSRSAFFPAGSWYTMAGAIASNRVTGSFQQITGHITETPMFLRGGYIIPTLQSFTGASIDESLNGTYTLQIGLSQAGPSIGALVVKDVNGAHSLNFEASFNNDALRISINSTCGLENPNYATIRTVIDQVRIFGHPFTDTKDTNITASWDLEGTFEPRYSGEHKALRIPHLDLDWCFENDGFDKHFEITITQQNTELETL